ncbi:WW domain-containing oxidoreductase-like [Hydra vulgaris]|uniref:WW domain-containing oxidoreductase n=1 Tax=Hydra vulgaris TaxID=6087 RepID=A0ABM4DNQ3_HYDVU
MNMGEFEDLFTDSEDELPCGWEMRVTDSGRVYYVDHKSKTTQWKHPKNSREKYLSPELPFGWSKASTEDGKIIFINHIENRTTCIDPRIAYSMSDKKNAAMKFDSYSSAMVVLRGRDMRGITAVITGANSGIGFETALALSLHGCHVILACRTKVKGEQAASLILKKQKIPVKVDVVECDLASLDSVKRCAETILLKKWTIKILICNAGVMGLPYSLSSDGIESTFAINHLGHFYLVNLLKDVLLSSAPARVIIVSSESHRFPSLYGDTFEIRDVPMKKSDYISMVAYNQSKLCNLLFAFELNRRLEPFGVTCNAVTPGCLISTSIQRHSYFYKLLFLLARPFAKSQSQGASTLVYCAASLEMEGVGGFYFNNCAGCAPSQLSSNEQLAKELWDFSEKLAFKKFDIDWLINI